MLPQSTNQVSVNYAQDVVKTKRDFHEALDRLGHNVAPIKSGGCTIDYLMKVRSGEIWCPKYVDVRLRSCYQPPKKEVLFNEIVNHLHHAGNLEFGFSDASKVPVEYLLRCLSTLNPEHKFFDKSYYPDEGKTNSKKQLPQD